MKIKRVYLWTCLTSLGGTVGGILWSVVWILEGGTMPVSGQSTIFGFNWDDYSRLTVIPLLLLLLTAISIQFFHMSINGVRGWIGFVLMAIAFCFLGWGVMTPTEGGRYLWYFTLPFIIGGQFIWGIAILRANTLPKLIGESLTWGSGLAVFGIIIIYVGEVILGIMWIVIGYALWRNRNTSDALHDIGGAAIIPGEPN